MNTARKNELTIVRLLDAPREKVWRALSEPQALMQWWGLPRDAAMPVCTADFRVGGTLHAKIEHDGMTLWFKWIYREIVAGTGLVMEQHYSDESGRELDSAERPVSTIALRLEDADGKTKLTVTQRDMASHVHRVEDFEAGWGESLDRLAESLAQ
jgi:uncharacterized protein YndB with AHSA1/START domain